MQISTQLVRNKRYHLIMDEKGTLWTERAATPVLGVKTRHTQIFDHNRKITSNVEQKYKQVCTKILLTY